MQTTPHTKKIFRQAEKLYSRGAYHEAYECYAQVVQQIVQENSYTTLTQGHLDAIERLSDLAVLFGNFAVANSTLLLLQDVAEAQQLDTEVDYTRIKRMHLHLEFGYLAAAGQICRELHAATGNMDDINNTRTGILRWERRRAWQHTIKNERLLLLSRFYYVYGLLLAAHGQYSTALLLYERGSELAHIRAPATIRIMYIPLLLARAEASLALGDIGSCNNMLEVCKRNEGENTSIMFIVQYHAISAKLQLTLGNPGSAQEHLVDIAATCRWSRLPRATLAASLNLAGMLIYYNRIEQALGYLGNIQTVLEQDPDTVLTSRHAALTLLAHKHRQSLAREIAFAPSVLEQWRKVRARSAAGEPQDTHAVFPDLSPSPNFLEYFEDRLLEVHFHLSQGNDTELRECVTQMLDTFDDTESPYIQLRLCLLKAIVSCYQGDVQGAVPELLHVYQNCKTMGIKSEQWQAGHVLVWSLDLLERDEALRTSVTREIDTILADMTASLDESDRGLFLLDKWTAEEKALFAEAEALVVVKEEQPHMGRWKRAVSRIKLTRRTFALRQRIDRYRGSIAHDLVQGAARGTMHRPSSLMARLRRYPRTKAEISFLVLPIRTIIICRYRGHIDFGVTAISRIELREKITQFHKTLHANGRNLTPLAMPDESLRQEQKRRNIIEFLVEKLQVDQILGSLPEHIDHVTIIPDDILHGFPFAGIMLQEYYLSELFTISFAHESRKVTSQHSESNVIIGNMQLVTVSHGSEPDYPALEGVEREAAAIRELCTARGLALHDDLLNDSATKAAVLKRLSCSDLIHFACHGTFRTDRPDLSGLVLIPQQHNVEILSLRDFATANLTHIQHITLSSCWGADSFILPGRWIISLPETLRRSGVGSILACLWPVDDKVAIAFMTRFYELLGTYSRADALRRTQYECATNQLQTEQETDTSNPAYWAGFQLYGESGPLQFRN